MVGILDNKKIADLVIEKPESEEGYEKINPKSLATIIYEDHGETPGTVTADVQQHIDNTSIHFTKQGLIEELNDKYLKPENVIGKGDIVVSFDSETRELSIETDVPSFDSYMKRSDILPQDETITLTPIEDTENGVYIRANIPDVSNFLVSSNVRAKDDTIFVERDQYSNNVYIKANPINYQAGEGLSIINGTITNTMPDKIVGLIEGDNIAIESNYPNFVISAKNKLNITPWEPDFKYVYGDVIIHNKGIYYCAVNESQKSAFDPEDWQVIADYKMTRYDFVTDDEPTQIINLQKDPEDPESKGLVEPINDTDTLIINVGGIIPISDTYRIRQDGFTLEFDEPIPANTPIEIMILGHSVLNEQDPTANINDWEPNVVYEVGNIVIYEDALYKCIERHPSEEEFDVTKWHILMSYTKDTYEFETTTETSSVTLPEDVSIQDKSNIEVNVGNTALLKSSFNIEDDLRTISFESPVEANTKIEVTVYTHGVLSIPEIPNPHGRKNVFLKSNDTGTAYETITKTELLRLLGLYTLTEIYGHNGSVIGVNSRGDDYEFINSNQLSAKVRLRNTTNGFNVLNADEVRSKTTHDLITFSSGSTLSEDETVLMATYQTLTKDFSSKWERGTNKGSLIDTDWQDIEWNSARDMVISADSPAERKLRVTASVQQSDREGWRALDAFTETGNGWLANTKSGVWQYANGSSDDYKPLKITKFKFRNQKQNGSSVTRSKTIDLWISNDTNTDDLTTKDKIKVATFTAYNNNTQETIVNIANPQYGKVFGFDVKDSYGNGIGALHVQMEGYIGSTMAPNTTGYIYVISNDEGNYTDIATSYHYDGEILPDESVFRISSILPQGYTKFKQIGIFKTDDNSKIWDVYPLEDINKFYINRNFVNQDQLNEIIDNYDSIIEDKVQGFIEENTYSKQNVDDLLSIRDESISDINNTLNNKVDKTTNASKVYGTNANGNQTTYDYNSLGKIDNIKINNVSGTVSNKVASVTLSPSNIGAAASSHTHASNEITKMTGYSKGSSSAAISTSDTLNAALGKIEKGLDNKVPHQAIAKIVYGTDNNKNDTSYTMEELAKALLGYIYPIGSIYITTTSNNPSNASELGFGTWSRVASGKALWTGNGSNGGTTIEAGLPNLTGSIWNDGSNDEGPLPGKAGANGVFAVTRAGNNNGSSGSSPTGSYNFDFNASRVNSIYGKSTTVQPPAYVVNVWKRTG